MSKQASTLEREYPGATASEPREIPKKGWLQVTKRAWAESKVDQVPLLAAGVAFYSFLSLFPAMIAAALLLGTAPDPLVAGIDPEIYSPGRFGGAGKS